MFKVPNQYRIKTGLLGSDDSIGLCGAFEIPWKKNYECMLYVIASDGESNGWEHVSVHGRTGRGIFTPSWDQMCFVKSLFWDDAACVVQYHPPKSDYVNVHKNCLHLWRKCDAVFETPPKELIG